MIKLVPSRSYTAHVVRAINAARARVYVLALIIQQSDDASDIITALNRAAHRGIDVRVMADFSTYSYTGGHLSPRTIYSQQSQIATDMMNRLSTSGVRFNWLGMKGPFIFAGRTHSKWIIADDVVFAFGGINLHPKFKADHDFMFMIHDQGVAQALASEHRAILDADNMDAAYLSHKVNTSYGSLLIDGGIPGDSVIYRRAVELARDAQSILMVTQYCPTGLLASLIKNTNHHIYFNRPYSRDVFTNALITFGERVSGIANTYAGSEYIHAKFMIVTHRDGSKTAITGSHNFISYGGLLGTREIALETQDNRIIAGLELYQQKYIA